MSVAGPTPTVRAAVTAVVLDVTTPAPVPRSTSPVVGLYAATTVPASVTPLTFTRLAEPATRSTTVPSARIRAANEVAVRSRPTSWAEVVPRTPANRWPEPVMSQTCPCRVSVSEPVKVPTGVVRTAEVELSVKVDAAESTARVAVPERLTPGTVTGRASAMVPLPV